MKIKDKKPRVANIFFSHKKLIRSYLWLTVYLMFVFNLTLRNADWKIDSVKIGLVGETVLKVLLYTYPLPVMK